MVSTKSFVAWSIALALMFIYIPGPIYAQTPVCSDPGLTIPATECEVLADMYSFMVGSSWSNNTNWLSNPDVSTWYGVTVTSGHVTAIDLSSNGLIGQLPGNLLDLPFLDILDLENNNISSLASNFQGPSSLTYINLGYNSIASIPNGFASLTGLVDLYLHNNDLTSLPDMFAGMDSLELLYLQWNALTSLPESISTLDQVTIFDVSHNTLGVLPDAIGGMTSLAILDLAQAGLTGLSTSLGNITNLQVLYVQNNALTSLPETIGNLTSLYYLSVDNNALTSLPETIGNLTDVQYLRLDGNQLTSLPSTFGQLQQLVTLYLNDNALTEIPASIGTIAGLRFVYLQDNAMTGTLPNSFSGLTNINRLYLYNNYLDRDTNHDASVPSALQTWYTNLLAAGKQVLLYNQGDITAPVITITMHPDPLTFGDAVELTFSYEEGSYAVDTSGSGLTIGMSGSAACDVITMSPTELMTMTGTVSLTLTGAGVFEGCVLTLTDHAGNIGTAMIDDFIIGNSYADYCGLSDFALSTTIPVAECVALANMYDALGGESWTNTTNWFTTTDVETWFGIRTNTYNGQEHVDGLFFQKSSGGDVNGIVPLWDGNGLQGSFPASMSDLTRLVYINVSKNSINNLPTVFGDLAYLQELYALDANITGTIPSTYENLDTLRVLQLPDNNLTGAFPDAIYGMTSLETLSLANNAFSGNLTIGIGALTDLTYLRLQGNDMSGPLPASLSTLGNLIELNIANNNFTGTLPSSWSALTNLSNLFLNGNALDRTANHLATIPSSLDTWFSNLAVTVTNDQRDIEAPVISTTDTIPWVVSGAFSYDIVVDENSYAVDLGGAGMQVTVSGSGVCASLLSSDVTINSGVMSLTLTPTTFGGYENCSLSLTDHADNTSNILTLDSFVYGIGNYTICYDPGLTIPIEECVALVDMYEATNGDVWYDTTNWLTTTDVGEWFGITVVGGHVEEIRMGGVYANNLQGSLPNSLSNLPYLSVIDVSENNISGSLPSSMSMLSGLEVINMSENNISGSLPVDIGNLSSLVILNFGANELVGQIPVSIENLDQLVVLDIHGNNFDTLPLSIGDMDAIQELWLQDNNFSGYIPAGLSGLSSLTTVSLAGNNFVGTIDTLSGLTQLEYLNISHNNFEGALPLWINTFDDIYYLSFASNGFTGTIPEEWSVLGELDTLYIHMNNLDRTIDPTHEVFIDTGSLAAAWYDGIATKQSDGQDDITPPVVTSPTVIPTEITEPFLYAINYVENSYAVNSSGAGLAVTFTGNEICATLLSSSITLDEKTAGIVLTITPLIDGIYNCSLEITDHGDNTGSVYMGPFTFSSECGNGVIDPGESCDEGRYCDDGTVCTNDASVCPTECRPRLVDTCNPSCEASKCGDAYVDPDGIDNIAGNYDDETCDEGSYCEDGSDCTRDPSICPGGSNFCKPRLIDDCNEFCTAGSCGDGTRDVNGEDNIVGTHDDEECDDGNPFNGDGCSSTCRLEYCGDGFADSNGPDNIVSTSDDEECDLGLSNGLAGGLCSTTCTLPDDECVFCYELCDGGTGTNSIFLLMDVSGSMNNNNRLDNAKQGATSFIDLVIEDSATNTGFQTKIGIIAFNDTSTIVIPPTMSYAAVKNEVDALTAGGGTNFGDAIQDAIDYFETHDTSWSQHMILLSDGEPTSSSNGSFTPGDWAIYQANNAKARGIGLYTIAVDQTDEGLEYMSHISSSTRLNHAWNKPTDQESTYTYWDWWSGRVIYPSGRAVNATKAGSKFSLTQEHYQPWWEVDLGEDVAIETVNVRNRTSNMHETANYRIHVSSTPFSDDDLDDILVDTSIDSFYFTGAAQRPSQHVVPTTGRYVRIQLTATNERPESTSVNLGLSEVEVIGCPADEECTSVYHYQDFGGASIETLYGHIFGSIHCGCTPERVCGLCGDGIAEPLKGEECDEGSYCDDLTTLCTSDPSLCLGIGTEECRPRFINGCTDTCKDYYCGDGQINQAREVCDDGNIANGDGCNAGCAIESCGDGYTDYDGPDNIWGTSDDEACDDGNLTDGDGCGATCIYETCGDGIVDLDGVDNIEATTGDNEQCDTGRSCSDGTDCTNNPTICPGDCRVSFSGLCTSSCLVGSCGDGYVQSGSIVVGTETMTLSESCDIGMFCEDNFTPCTDTPHFCSLLAIGGGTCAPRTIGSCTAACTINICGDGYVGGSETCDDGNIANGDGCTASCELEYCGDGLIDSNGPDNILNTLDDELCDDGNLIDGDGCSSCKLDSCGNGVLEAGEECDTSNTQICSLPYCRLTSCGDAARQWPNGSGTGGADNDGYEACDGDVGCQSDCTYSGSVTFCGDGIQQDPNDLGVNELCDDGKNNGSIGYCSLDCLELPTCGDGVVTSTETCDDGNLIDGDGCSALCVLESPLVVPPALIDSCVSGTLPVVNPGEWVPVWWQLDPVNAVALGASDCASAPANQWILGDTMECTFGLRAGSIFGQSLVSIAFSEPCLETSHASNAMLLDALNTHANNTTTYPILGSTLMDPTLFVDQFNEQQGQYTLTLDELGYDYCVNLEGGGEEQRSTTYTTNICIAELPVTADYIVQQGAALQEVSTTSLDNFVDIYGATLLTVGTLLDEEDVTYASSQYQGTAIDYLTDTLVTRYEDLGVTLLQGVWGVDIWKVPNQRMYIYKDTQELHLDAIELEQIVGDLTEPFTVLVANADLVFQGSLGSLTTKTAGMFIVNGSVTFNADSCDTTDIIQGIFVANDGFTATATRNTLAGASEWCDAGNLIVQGLLIGANIDAMRQSKRGTLNAWDTDTISYMSYVYPGTTLGGKARKLFDICYFPALVAGMSTSLQGPGICDHATLANFVDDAEEILQPYVQDWMDTERGVMCEAPAVCTGTIPLFTCMYDDVACYVETDIECNGRVYTCGIKADEYEQTTINEEVTTCTPADTTNDCLVPYQECTVDMLTNTLTCVEHCFSGPATTCPVIGSLTWHDAIQDMVRRGVPVNQATVLPSTHHIKQAFDTFDRDMIVNYLNTFGMTLAGNDIAWLSNGAHIQQFDNEQEERKILIVDGSAMVIQTAPWIWQDLPPGGAEMLENIQYFTR